MSNSDQSVGPTHFPLLSEQAAKNIFYGIVFLWILYLMITAWGFKWTDKTFPLLVGLPTLLIISFQLLSINFPDIVSKLTPEEGGSILSTEAEDPSEQFEAIPESDQGRPRGEQQKVGLITVGWVLLLLVMIYLVGYIYALPSFVFGFGMFYLRDVRKSLAMTVGFSLFAYLLFILLLGIRPWNGILGLPNLVRFLP